MPFSRMQPARVLRHAGSFAVDFGQFRTAHDIDMEDIAEYAPFQALE